ncbi:MAG: acetyl-CoA carboxylase carboxyltransferase subunit alpha [Planctomycetota bacterium]|nr:MAG: acetyl-CoA carboxylase carboxyltransferase subunit alpha [Planctomycetota bacterium]
MAETTSGELSFEGPIVELQRKIEELESFAASTEIDLSGQIDQLKARCIELQKEVVANLSAWERIQLARHPGRPLFSDYLANLFEEPLELHGDMAFGDDHAIYTGLAKFQGRSVLLVGHRKGKNTKERIRCNFGSAHPEGYRKALAKMRLAEKYRIPILTFIDTPGAYPGVGAEERGQAQAIARNILEMSRLRTPIVCLVIGEGGSGGALGIGVGDRLLMMENAYYSVISPEGCSSILWKSADHAPRAAAILKLTAKDLLRFRIIDEIVAEPPGGAQTSIGAACRLVEEALARQLEEVCRLPTERLLEQRYEKIRRIGVFLEDGAPNFVPPPEEEEEPAAR